MTEPETAKPTRPDTCPVCVDSFTLCGRESYADDPKGYCICHSENRKKDSDAFQREVERMLAGKNYNFRWFVFPDYAVFPRAVFAGDASFAHATFQGKAAFGTATFHGEAAFYYATFQGAAHFGAARFQDAAHFEGATFQGEARFWHAMFQGEAAFLEATFQGEAHFEDATFHGVAHFGGATFQGAAHFQGATFHGAAGFWHATFQGAAGFVGEEEKRVFSESHDADFSLATFERAKKVEFAHVNLRRARFVGTDVREVDFTDVKWAPRSFWRKPVPCSAAWDELRREGKGERKDYQRIRKLYQQLKENYEERRDPITAGDFHFGDMEMRRLAPREDRRSPLFLFLYRWISGYGEDYILPLVWIGAVLVGFALAFAYVPSLALRPSAGSTAAAISGCFWQRMQKTLLYSAMCFLLRPEKYYQPVNDLGRYLSLAEGVIGPVLIAMFTLALNRRFKR